MSLLGVLIFYNGLAYIAAGISENQTTSNAPEESLSDKEVKLILYYAEYYFPHSL